jgi:hypothetical protein
MNETFTIYAEDGEYAEDAPGLEQALAQFRARHPGLHIAAIVADAMQPRLVVEDVA